MKFSDILKKGVVGFSYGVSFPLTIVILDYWLKDCGVSNTTIGLFSFFHLPFALKIFFAPIIDDYSIPYLSKVFGKRRSWVIFSQFMLIISILCMANIDPKTNIFLLMTFATFVAIFDGFQNIALYPYQMSNIIKDKLGYAAAIINLGHRVGTILIKFIILYVSHFMGWKIAYEYAAFVIFICMILIAFIDEPIIKIVEPIENSVRNFTNITTEDRINIIIICKKLILQLKKIALLRNAKSIFAILLLYKTSDFFVQKMSRSFCIEVGFSKLEIANVVQIFGSVSVIFGGVLVGYFMTKYKVTKVMFLALFIHMLFLFSYLFLCFYGNNIRILHIVIFLEGISGGAVSTVFIAFLYELCKTGSQYALVWAIHEISGIIFRLISGLCVDIIGWPIFFTITPLLSIPVLIILRNMTIENNNPAH